MSTVIIPKDFFRKERDQFYFSWPSAFWRELIQNSVDAGASVIGATITGTDKSPTVVFSDDGKGMDRETLENVFFRLGASNKTEDGVSIGGFGRARLLTCFAQKAYRIRTGKLSVTGEGGEYEITEVEEDFPGCRFEIDVDGIDAKTLIRRLKSVVEISSPEIQVSLECDIDELRESTVVSGMLTSGRTRRVLRDTNGVPFARLKTTEEKSDGACVIVRCRGLSTVATHVGGVTQNLILDVEPKRIREVLIGNRDNFRPPFDAIVNELYMKLSQQRTVLESEDSDILEIAGGESLKNAIENGGGIDSVAFVSETVSKPVRAMKPSSDGSSQANTPADPDEADPDAAEAIVVSLEHQDEVPRERIPVDEANEKTETVVAETQRSVMAGVDHPVLINMRGDARAMKRQRRYAKEFDPKNWTRTEGRSSRILLAAWRSAIESSLAALRVSHPNLNDIKWAVGWVFDTESRSRALMQKLPNSEVNAFLLSPVDREGKKRYKRMDRDVFLQLMAIAQHEVAHILVSDHNEDYATALTIAVMANFDQKSAIAAMQKAIAAVPLSGISKKPRAKAGIVEERAPAARKADPVPEAEIVDTQAVEAQAPIVPANAVKRPPARTGLSMFLGR